MSETQEYIGEALHVLTVELPAAAKKAREAKSLEELCHGLQEIDDAQYDMKELMKKIAGIKLNNLPTFGGDEPVCDFGPRPYSWDNDRMLLLYGGWDIVPRPDAQREEID